MPDQQLAVARPTRGESTHLSKAARQVVPPFLQKLYEIVNDPRNDELIRWSENGDSFYVLNHERFAREVLGQWFKHQKFTSFVRQLNMYGFHKIPHLQQGVLRSDSDTEPWHFEHPHFHRGQPDLLCLIQRKKAPHGTAEDIQLEVHEPTHVAASPVANLTNGQVLDINSVVNGIAAIKRHQQAISADLNELKTSNQQLWQEALAARERHKKHQDTINRILKFLAGVFGHSATASQHKSDGSPGSPPRVVIPRKRQRLMIQDVEKGKEPTVQEVDDDDEPIQVDGTETSYTSPTFASISTPDTSIRSPSLGPSETFSPAVTEIPPTFLSNAQAIRPSDTLSRSSTTEPTNKGTNAEEGHPTSGSNDQNNMWSMMQQMFSSPSSMQKLMQALATQQSYPVANLQDPSHPPVPPATTTLPEPATGNPASSQQVMMYDPNPYDFSRFHLADNNAAGPMLSALGSPLRRDEDDTSTTALEPLLDNAARLQKSYQDTADIESDVDALQMSINTLIEGLGLDPTALVQDNPNQDDPVVKDATPSLPPAVTNSTPLSSLDNTHAIPSAAHPLDAISSDPPPEFDFENFFNELSARSSANDLNYPDVTSFGDGSAMGIPNADANSEQLAAFLDEVSSDANSSLADEVTATSAAANQASKGRKRKSEVVELPAPLGSSDAVSSGDVTPPQTKKKR